MTGYSPQLLLMETMSSADTVFPKVNYHNLQKRVMGKFCSRVWWFCAPKMYFFFSKLEKFRFTLDVHGVIQVI